jgi:NADH-quinone oxidoreductase subunit L
MEHLFPIQYSYLIPLLPLVGAVIAGFFGAKWLKGLSHWPIWIGVGISAILSIMLLFGALNLNKEHAEAAPSKDAASNPLATSVNWYSWIPAGEPSKAGTKDFFDIPAGFFFDTLTCVMLCVVCVIGFLISLFAAGYMKGEDGYFRFFAYVGLFIFMMTILVMGNNLVMLYLGWEGVGLCSYLLIGYYYDRPAAREAAKKAFIVNRVGDFGFALGIMLCFLAFGTVTFFGAEGHAGQGLLELAMHPATDFQSTAMQWIPFLLMIGAFGKSAQFPLYVWLPDAMEGPTPVSALIHAATMVTAGVYMIARCGTLFVGNSAAMITVAGIGGFTAIFAASIAMRQFDLKKVFAYSTVSQLGYMFVGVGCLAPVAGVFHLMTHAFFKALLFLSSGVVMHAMAGELDMRKLSGLKRVLPKTNILMLIGCLALAGFPFFSGFFSKDEIIHHAMQEQPVIGVVLLIAAFMTAYYTFRLYFRVFQGPEMIPDAPAGHGHAHGHDDAHGHASASASAVMTGDVKESGIDQGQTGHVPAHEPDHAGHHDHEPMILILPLVVLAIGALLAGYFNWPKEGLGGFLGHSPSFQLAASMVDEAQRVGFGQHAIEHNATEVAHSPFNAVMLISGLIAVAGIGLAYWLHLKDRATGDRLAVKFGGLTRLLDAKFWVDEVYQAAIIEPLRKLGVFFFAIDRFIVDGLVWLVSFIPQLSGFALKLTTQRGYLQGYALTMVLGVTVILVLFFW